MTNENTLSEPMDTEFGALLEAAVDAIVVIDEKGVILEFNKAAERLFDYQRVQVLGRNVKLLMPSEHAERHDGYLQHYLNTGDSHIIGIGRDLQGVRRDGSVFPLNLSVGRADRKTQVLFVGILRDLTERIAYETEIMRQHQELSRIGRRATAGELAATLAHELNQPLTAISAYSGAAGRYLDQSADDPAAIEKCRQALAQIQNQAQRAGEVISGVRAFLSGEQTERSVVSVAELIDEILPIMQMDAKAHSVQLITTIAAANLQLEVSKIQIQQVLVNLVRNAVDATADNSQARSAAVHLQTGIAINEQIEFRVSDNGPGIDAEFRAKLFTPFTSTKASGLGMGLSISQSIIEAHGDRIHVESDGDGSKFWFLLPIRRMPANTPHD